MTVIWLHAAVIWVWHMPYFYMLAVRNPWWHVIEHAMFLISSGLFWWLLLRSSSRQLPWAFLAVRWFAEMQRRMDDVDRAPASGGVNCHIGAKSGPCLADPRSEPHSGSRA